MNQAMSQATDPSERVNGPAAEAPPALPPAVVIIRRPPNGYTAEMVGVPGVFAAVDFEELLEAIRENYWQYGIGPQTPEELAAEEAEDRAAIDAARDEPSEPFVWAPGAGD